MQRLTEAKTAPTPKPADPKIASYPKQTVSREQLKRDTYDVREKSRDRLANVG